MSTTEAVSSEAPPRRRRWLRWLGVMLLAGLLVAVAFFVVDRYRAESAVARAVTELDASDPGWKLEDLEADRGDVPDHENSARLIVAAKGRMPAKWPLREQVFTVLDQLKPCERLPEALAARLAAEMPAKAGPALAATRPLADRPRGRHQFKLHRFAYSTLLPDQQESRGVCQLWHLEALRLAEKGDGDGALRAARAAFNAGRSIGDEPFAISQMIRTACVLTGGRAAERVLGLTEPSPKELLALQRLAEDEARFPAYRVSMRGERAAAYSTYKGIASGEVPFHQLAESGEGWGAGATDWFGRALSRRDFPRLLALLNRAVAITAAPPWEQAGLEAALRAEMRELPHTAVLTRLLLPAIDKIGESCRRKQASMHALAVALAAERYRAEHKAWPTGLTKLVPAYLAAVPADPFDGAAMRYRREAGGVVVYSVGPDGKDNGGYLCAAPAAKDCDIGYRLYDPAGRRRPAPPVEMPEGGEGDGEP